MIHPSPMSGAIRAETRAALAARYDALWDDAAPVVRAGRGTIDPWVARRHADPRRGLTLLARPGADLTRRLQEFLAELRADEPEQYFQPAADMHLTVLSLFGATADPAPYVAHLEAYRAAAAEALRGVPPFRVEIEGVTLSPGAVLAQAFPATARWTGCASGCGGRSPRAAWMAGWTSGIGSRRRT